MTGSVLGRPETVDPLTPPDTSTQVNLDTAYQELMDANPNDFYDQAGTFDTIANQLSDHAGQFGNQVRNLNEVWDGSGWTGYSDSVGDLNGHVTSLIQALRDPDYATLLRQAGDALASGQQRINALKSQRDQQVTSDPTGAANDAPRYDYLAQQIMQDVQNKYVQIGQGLSHLPDYTSQGNPNWTPGDTPPPEITDTSKVWTGTGYNPGGPVITSPGGFFGNGGGFFGNNGGGGYDPFSGVAIGRPIGVAGGTGEGWFGVNGGNGKPGEGMLVSDYQPIVSGVLGSSKGAALSGEGDSEIELTADEQPLAGSFSVQDGVLRGTAAKAAEELVEETEPEALAQEQGLDSNGKLATNGKSARAKALSSTEQLADTQTSSTDSTSSADDPSSDTVNTVSASGGTTTPALHSAVKVAVTPATATASTTSGTTTPATPQHAAAQTTPAASTTTHSTASTSTAAPEVKAATPTTTTHSAVSTPTTSTGSSTVSHAVSAASTGGSGATGETAGNVANATGSPTNAPPAPSTGAPAASAENPTTAPSEVGSPTVPTGQAEIQPSGVTEAVSSGTALPNPSEPYQVIPANGSATLDAAATTANQGTTGGTGTAMGRGMMPMGMGGGGMVSPDRDRTALFHADAGEWGPGMGLPLALGRPEPPPPPAPEPMPARRPVPPDPDGDSNGGPDGNAGPAPGQTGRRRGRPGPNGRGGPNGQGGPNGRGGPAAGKPVPGKPAPGKPGPAPRGGKRNG